MLSKFAFVHEQEARRLMDRHLGICLDLTHMAVRFEEPLDVLKKLTGSDIPIFKIQIGSALQTKSTGRLPEKIIQFKDNVYLHQTSCMDENSVLTHFHDIPEPEFTQLEGAWRVHYHIPLTWEGNDDFVSTRNEITSTFFDYALNTAGIKHFEVETYTLGVFPDKSEHDNLILAKELEWVFQMMTQ